MTHTDTELAIIAAVAATSAGHPVLFGQRLTLTIKYTSGAQPAATPRTITVRVRTTVHMPLFADIWASTGPAVARFAAGVAGWVRKIATKPGSGPEQTPRDRVDRADRQIGVVWHKRGMTAGWTRALSQEPTQPSTTSKAAHDWRNE